MELYRKNKDPLNDSLFENPTSEYRGTPFWAWNCQMTKEKVTMIVDTLKDMGMGGGHIHCRTGMNNSYMSEEFLDLVKDANEKFKERDMVTWLYDEDRWPSGSGGGMVTKDHKYRMRFLILTPEKLKEGEYPHERISGGTGARGGERRLLGHYQVSLENGWLKDYRKIEPEQQPEEGYGEWFAYLEISGDNPWFNNQSYVNTLDRNAIEQFIEVTHEKYYEILGEEFSKSIYTIFTDEPQFCHKTRLNFADDWMDIIIPFTDDLDETFTETYHHSLLESLPELFWDKKGNEVSQTRYQYHDHICERFACAFADTIGEWCRNHNLMLTGHMMEEPTLMSQTTALGEAMRSYRSFQLPGIDMLCDRRELSTAKQAQSASHQFGCPGVLSELYGVTNWDFDFRGHKLQGDWQAALGVTVRVHHLTWTSMAGEAKRDYPASIGYQSPWYKEYHYVEDYFARINTLLTRGKADVRIGVIHPIESYWLYWGSEEKTGGIREEQEQNFDRLIKWLLYGFMDFDFISESLLVQQNNPENNSSDGFNVGNMKYQIVLVPNCVTLRSSTLERLKAWREKGGNVIFTGETPSYLDAVPSEEVKTFVEECTWVPFTNCSLLAALDHERIVDVRNEVGLRAENLIYQMRDDENETGKIFFLAHVNKSMNPDIPKKEKLVISFEGLFEVTCYEAMDGTKEKMHAEYQSGKTVIRREMYEHDSLLLYLVPIEEIIEEKSAAEGQCVCEKVSLHVPEKVKVELSEPNVLVLDQAEYAFNHGAWQEKEELLRIDNKFRSKLGWPLRMESFAQPWLDQTEEIPMHTLSLRFEIVAEKECYETVLALENQSAEIYLNGEKISQNTCGWYVDTDILCRSLGTIKKGINELIIHIPYRKKENIEYMFLLGDFGVQAAGAEAVLTDTVRELSFGDSTQQGLPFYGGNIAYHVPVDIPEDGTLQIRTSYFRSPVVKIGLDDTEEKMIAYAPYTAEIKAARGKHVIKITAFGNRVNTFGTLHNCDRTETWYGPDAWRTTGDSWAYEYQIRPFGVLKTPEIKLLKSIS